MTGKFIFLYVVRVFEHVVGTTCTRMCMGQCCIQIFGQNCTEILSGKSHVLLFVVLCFAHLCCVCANPIQDLVYQTPKCICSLSFC